MNSVLKTLTAIAVTLLACPLLADAGRDASATPPLMPAAASAAPPGSGDVVATYIVTPDIPTLGEIAIFLYGSTRYVPRIAAWNSLVAPYVLSPGQTLKLRKAPKLDAAAGSHQLVEMWRTFFRVDSGPASASTPQSCEDLMSEGRAAQKAGRLDDALVAFHRCRLQAEDTVEPWLNELRVLRQLGHAEAARVLKDKFLQAFPGLQSLPELGETR